MPLKLASYLAVITEVSQRNFCSAVYFLFVLNVFVSGHDMGRKNRYYFCGELVRYLGKSQIAIAVVGAGKNSTDKKEFVNKS
ncbi:hypothetical protein [Streptococcus suis]|uniref:hypothetical protein n=1 Tax=Streptococcus suis TaxID=1307 RepID=UPI001ABC7181|nr:hypothetical protein [Streptococcus suis]MBO3643054.1 hypothetical protein [Streptococcus suis]